MSGFLNNSSCGFAKVAVHLCNVNKPFFTNNINIDEILNIIFFEERDDYRVDNMQNFRNGMLRLKCIFDKLSKHNGAAKKCFFQTFSPENFMKLDTDGRRKHTLYNCMGCLNNAKYNEAINKLQNVKPAKKNTPIIAEVTAMEELNKLNEAFSHTFKQSFSSIIANIPDSHMIMKQEEEKRKYKH